MTGLCEKLWEHIPATISPRFVGELPSQSDEGVALSPDDGQDNTTFFATSTAIRRPYVQCLIRTKEYSKGEKFGEQVIKSLDGFSDGTTILQVRAQSALMYIGRNEEKLHEFQVMFKILVKE